MLKKKNRGNYKGGKNITCIHCGKDFYCWPYQLKEGRKFCSQSCYYQWQKGQPKPKPANFSETMRKVNPPAGRKIKKRAKGGYVYVFRPNHPNARQVSPDFGYVSEHVVIMANHIKRPIIQGEVIHHINGVKDDNRIENLLLCGNSSKHNKIHTKMEEFIEELIKEGLVFYDRGINEFKRTKKFKIG